MTDNSEALLREALVSLRVDHDQAVGRGHTRAVVDRQHLGVALTALTRPSAASNGDLEDEVAVFLRAYGDAFVREVLKQAAPVSDGGAVREALRALWPKNLARVPDHLADDFVFPLDVTAGELRAVAAALAAQPSPASSTDVDNHDRLKRSERLRKAAERELERYEGLYHRVAPFIAEIKRVSPNGEPVTVKLHPNGDWSVFDAAASSTDVLCKGSWELGTACGKCPRCLTSQPSPPPTGSEREKVIEECARIADAAVLTTPGAEGARNHMRAVAAVIRSLASKQPTGSEQ